VKAIFQIRRESCKICPRRACILIQHTKSHTACHLNVQVMLILKYGSHKMMGHIHTQREFIITRAKLIYSGASFLGESSHILVYAIFLPLNPLDQNNPSERDCIKRARYGEDAHGSVEYGFSTLEPL